MNPRLLAVAAAAVVIVILLIVLAVSVLRRDSATTEQEVVDTVSDAIVAAQAEAETGGAGFVDMAALRTELDAISGFVVGLKSTSDGMDVGVAARKIEGPACVLVWTSAGGPRSATVYDPNLPCVPAMALEAAASS